MTRLVVNEGIKTRQDRIQTIAIWTGLRMFINTPLGGVTPSFLCICLLTQIFKIFFCFSVLLCVGVLQSIITVVCFISAEAQLIDMLKIFNKVGLVGVMAGAPGKVGEMSSVNKRKETTEERPQVWSSPRNNKLEQLEEAWMKFHVGSVRIPKLPEYVDSWEELLEPIWPHPPSDYVIQEPELLSEVQIKGTLLVKIDGLTYCDHGITDMKKFLRFQPDQYLIYQ